MNGFGDIGQNGRFGPKWPFLNRFGHKKNWIFLPKSKNDTSVALLSHNFVQVIRKSYERILKSTNREIRTDGRKRNHRSQPLVTGDQKLVK